MCVYIYIYIHRQLIVLHNWNSVSQLYVNKICIYGPCLTLCSPMDCSPPGSSVHGILQGRILGCHFLLQMIFPTQGSNLNLLHCRQILYRLNHQRSPAYMYMRVCLCVYIHKNEGISVQGDKLWEENDCGFWVHMTQVLRSGEGRSRTCLLEEVTDKTVNRKWEDCSNQREQDVQKFGGAKESSLTHPFSFSAIIHRASTVH